MEFFEIKEMAAGFQKSRILLTAFELNIFTTLDIQAMSADALAKKLHLNPPATERLCNALVGLQLLKKVDHHFHNTPISLKFLDQNSPDYMPGIQHSNHLWNTWSHLTDVVRTGEPANISNINDRGKDWLEAFIFAMHDRGKKQAPAQVAKIKLDGISSVLDVGGGSGCFSMEFLRRKPEIRAAIFDLPNVLPITKSIVEKEGFAGQIEPIAGNYTTDELPTAFDLTFLSAIIHSNSSVTNQDLVHKCYRALNTGGKIVIQDWIMNDTKTEPAQGTIFAINMMVGVQDGDCFSESEVGMWLTNAGFTDIQKVELENGLAQMHGVKK